MNYCMDVLLCGLTTFGIFIFSIMVGILILGLIQFIFYRFFNINLYKKLNYILFIKNWND